MIVTEAIPCVAEQQAAYSGCSSPENERNHEFIIVLPCLLFYKIHVPLSRDKTFHFGPTLFPFIPRIVFIILKKVRFFSSSRGEHDESETMLYRPRRTEHVSNPSRDAREIDISRGSFCS
jgi:hypothetical protein